jgi:hypothetical protein
MNPIGHELIVSYNDVRNNSLTCGEIRSNTYFKKNNFKLNKCFLLHTILLAISLSRVELSVKSPCLWACFDPYPQFHWYLQSKEILLHLSMRCWNWAFHAQGSRLVVQVREVKIYVTTMGAARKKERQDETQFTTKISEKISLGPSYFVLWNFHSQLSVWCPIMPKLAVLAP